MLHSFYLSTFSPDQETGTPFAVDAIISNPATFAAEHLAEMGGIPLVMSFSKLRVDCRLASNEIFRWT